VDFCRLISRKRFYPSLKGNKSIQQWVRSIAAAGYSEAPVVWQQRVMSTIRKNRL
jgi:Bax protein